MTGPEPQSTVGGFEQGTKIGPRYVVALIVFLGMALTIPFLDSRSLWLDESVSVMLSRLEWGTFADVVREREGNMSLYSLVLRLWSVTGDSDAAVRSLSVVFATGTIPVVYLLARRLFDTRTALVSALLLVVNGMFVQYGQEARGYALCLFLVAVSSYLFVRGIQQPSRAIWLGYAGTTALAVYAHYFALFIPPSHIASLPFLPRPLIPWRRMIEAGFTFGLLLAPLAALLSSAQGAGVVWASGSPAGRLIGDVREAIPRPLAALATAIALAIAARLAMRLRVSGRIALSEQSWRAPFILSCLFVPVVLAGFTSFFYKPLIVIRYFIVILPPAAITFAWLISRFRRPVNLRVALAGAVALGLVSTTSWYRNPEVEDWRNATGSVAASARPGDGVLFYAPYVRVPFEHYLGATARTMVSPVYPPNPWGTSEKVIGYVKVESTEIARAAVAYDRIWLVLSHVALYGQDDPDYRAVQRGLTGNFREAGSDSFRGVRVIRYERTSNAP